MGTRQKVISTLLSAYHIKIYTFACWNMNRFLTNVRCIFWGFILLLSASEATAQDPIYSQYFSAPLYTNPALGGSHAGSYRLFMVFRNQWFSTIDNPYKTFTAGGDFRFAFANKKAKNPDYASVGLIFHSDRVALFDFNTTGISLNLAYQKSLDRHAIHYLGAGFQLGVVQKNVNYENVNFQDQFNNIDAFEFPTGEILPPNNFGYLDLSLGLNYSATIKKENKLLFGFALQHFNASNLSFYNKSTLTNPDLIREVGLPTKYTINAAYVDNASEGIQISPRILSIIQGPDFLLNAGANAKFALDRIEDKSLNLGLYGKVVKSVDGTGLESIIFASGYQLKSLVVGLSFDLNLREIAGDQKGFNTFELSLTYIGAYENDDYICPEF